MAEKVTIGNCELWHGDCREVLPLLPDFDLLMTDPPYGIGADAARYRWLKSRNGLMLCSEPANSVWKRGDGTPFTATHQLVEGGMQHRPADGLDAMIDAAMIRLVDGQRWME